MPARRLLPARFIRLLLLLLTVLPGLARAQGSNPFESEIRAFELADSRNPPATNSLLFIGSSSIRLWTGLADALPEYHVLNRGFGGSQAGDVLHFFDRIVTPYRPPLIVFYEGDNDLAGGRSVDAVFGDWTNFVARVEAALPATHIMFLSVKPSPSRVQFLAATRELNDRVRDHCAGDPRLRFADVFTPMLNAAGQPRPELFGSDNLHLNAAGYALWESVVGPAIEAWAAGYPVTVKKPETGTLLLDFGSDEFPSGGTGPVTPVRWNNVSASLGANSSGALANVVATDGAVTGVALRMVSRFNGANENGTVASAQFPASATRDSLFGNTETFSGLANVTPVFRLTGLAAGTAYRLTFHASRLAVNDNRETRYTVNGATSAFADLNVANNVEETASVSGILPDVDGAITVALTPGPQNNNANHFTYLGVLRVDPLNPSGPGMLFDFGSAGSPTGDQPSPAGPAWNDVPAATGTDDAGEVTALVTTAGTPTGIALRMVSRFNGANLNGTRAATVFPASATRDSLYGNTETFNGLTEVTPVFKLTGLNPAGDYAFTFHASREGAGDNRETRYTVTGANAAFADLDAANNVDATAIVAGIRPDALGEVTVALTPGPDNNNANHFVYLGALQVDWAVFPTAAPRLSVQAAGGKLRLRLYGSAGRSYRLQHSSDLEAWVTLQNLTLAETSQELELNLTPAPRFFRLIE